MSLLMKLCRREKVCLFTRCEGKAERRALLQRL